MGLFYVNIDVTVSLCVNRPLRSVNMERLRYGCRYIDRQNESATHVRHCIR